jgi:hypothetical protein
MKINMNVTQNMTIFEGKKTIFILDIVLLLLG